jgi:hypothetical protein
MSGYGRPAEQHQLSAIPISEGAIPADLAGAKWTGMWPTALGRAQARPDQVLNGPGLA